MTVFPRFSPDALEASIVKSSFYDFFLRFWPQISPEPLVANWHIKYLCDELQAVAERVIARKPKEYDLVINIPPGTSKSSICSIMLPAWMWAKDPTIQALCCSHGYGLSLTLGGKFRTLAGSEKYKRLFPNVTLVAEGKELAENDKGGWRFSCSVGSAPTGKHAHIQVFDDLIDAQEALSPTVLRQAEICVTQVMPSRMVNVQLTPVILLMQRLAIGDPTDVILRNNAKGGTPVRFICLPAEVSELVRPRALRRNYQDGLLDPVRLPRKELRKKRAEIGQYGYAGQYDQRPIPAGGGMFRTDMVKIIQSVGLSNFPSIVRYIDKAGTEKGGAFTACVKMGKRKNGDHWEYVILDIVRGQWEAAERERIIRNTAIMDGRRVVVVIEQEPGSGGKESAQATTRNLAGFIVKKERPVGNKVARADAFATQVNDGNLSIVQAPWNEEFLQELRLFWFGPYKDQVDASSGAFNFLVGKLRVGGLEAAKPVPSGEAAKPKGAPVLQLR